MKKIIQFIQSMINSFKMWRLLISNKRLNKKEINWKPTEKKSKVLTRKPKSVKNFTDKQKRR